MDITVVIRIIAGGLQIHPCYSWNGPAGTCRENDVVLMSMRRDLAPTLIWRHFGTNCPLGRVDSHCTILSESTFYWILKGEKERLISLYKCAGKFENGQYAHWSSFSIVRTPPLSISTNIPPSEYHPNLSPPPPPHPLGTLIKRSS